MGDYIYMIDKEIEEVTVKSFIENADLFKYKKPLREVLIKNYLPRGIYYGSMYGASGSGKTFIALDMDLTIASGLTSWHGIPCEQAKVAYLTKEGNASLPTRIKCWADYHKIDYSVIRDNFFIFSDEADYSSIVMNQKSQEYKDLVKELEEKGPFGLVTLDTFMEFFDGESESDSKEMQNFNNAVKTFAKELKTNVMVIHHCGKWNTKEAKNDCYFMLPDGRGSSAMKGALDYQFGIGGKIKETRGAKFMITKSKDLPLEGEESALFFNSIKYELKDLGKDKYGDYESSLVIKKGKESKILDNTITDQKKWLEEIMGDGRLQIEYRLNLPDSPKGLPFITSDNLRKVIHEYLGESPETNEKGIKDPKASKRILNEMNPTQDRFIGRFVKVGLLKADTIKHGKYRYDIIDNFTFENNAGVWNLPNPDEGTSIETNPKEEGAEKKEVTKVTT